MLLLVEASALYVKFVLSEFQRHQKWNATRRNFVVKHLVVLVDDIAPRNDSATG